MIDDGIGVRVGPVKSDTLGVIAFKFSPSVDVFDDGG